MTTFSAKTNSAGIKRCFVFAMSPIKHERNRIEAHFCLQNIELSPIQSEHQDFHSKASC